MSSLAISNSASTTLPAVNPHRHGHGHTRGMPADSLSTPSTSASTTAQLPVGAAQGLFASLLQSLQQVIGVQPVAATTATGATGAAGGTSTGTASSVAGGTASATTVTPALAQDLQGFLHSLFQVLKQEASGTGAGSATPGTLAAASSIGVNGAAAVTGAGQYQESLASSLQALIQQVGSTGPATPAIANLGNSFNNLMIGLTGNTASPASTSAIVGTASTVKTSNAALQTFLNDLLQNLQASGLQAPKLKGTTVNANV